MRSLVFEGNTWQKYETLRGKNKVVHKKLCKVLREMLRSDPAQGIGKPEKLRGDLSGLWSRRIGRKDRLVYRFDDHSIHIFAIGGHYEDQ